MKDQFLTLHFPITVRFFPCGVAAANIVSRFLSDQDVMSPFIGSGVPHIERFSTAVLCHICFSLFT